MLARFVNFQQVDKQTQNCLTVTDIQQKIIKFCIFKFCLHIQYMQVSQQIGLEDTTHTKSSNTKLYRIGKCILRMLVG